MVKANGGEDMTTEAHHKGWLIATLLAALLAVGLLALAWPTTPPADAAGFKTVTKTFGQPDDVEIPEDFDVVFGPAEPYPSLRFIGGSGFPDGAKVVDVNLKLRDFGHGDPDDVDMMLVHQGVNRTVFSDAGAFFNVDNLTIVLDDEAQAPPPIGNPLTSGTFKPVNYTPPNDFFEPPAPTQTANASLGGFDGLNPEGQWKLFVFDDDHGNSGSLAKGWSLTIKAMFPAG